MGFNSISAGSVTTFDMIQYRLDQSLSPGNEQAFYFGSSAADNQGTRNYMGAKDPAIDAMITAILEAREQSDCRSGGPSARSGADVRASTQFRSTARSSNGSPDGIG